MENAKPFNTPMGVHFNGSAFQAGYCNSIGSLMYGMMGTRPVLAYPVGLVSRFMSDPIREHWEAVKWVLRYIRGSLGMHLT